MIHFESKSYPVAGVIRAYRHTDLDADDIAALYDYANEYASHLYERKGRMILRNPDVVVSARNHFIDRHGHSQWTHMIHYIAKNLYNAAEFAKIEAEKERIKQIQQELDVDLLR